MLRCQMLQLRWKQKKSAAACGQKNGSSGMLRPDPAGRNDEKFLDRFIMDSPLQNLSHWLRNPRSLYLDL